MIEAPGLFIASSQDACFTLLQCDWVPHQVCPLYELWKTPLERKPNSGNRDTKLRRPIKEDGNNKGRSKNSNGKNKGNDEKAI